MSCTCRASLKTTRPKSLSNCRPERRIPVLPTVKRKPGPPIQRVVHQFKVASGLVLAFGGFILQGILSQTLSAREPADRDLHRSSLCLPIGDNCEHRLSSSIDRDVSIIPSPSGATKRILSERGLNSLLLCASVYLLQVGQFECGDRRTRGFLDCAHLNKAEHALSA